MRRNAYVSISVLLLCLACAGAQTRQLVQIEADSFPIIRGLLAPVDENGEWGDDRGPCSIFENGIPRALLSIDCPDNHPTPPLASVLAIDVSESMGVHDPGLNLTHYAARRWIEQLALGYDRCAVVLFDDSSKLLLPWTTNGLSCVQVVLSSRPGGGGTFYTAALTDAPDGAIHVAAGASGKRVILLITDGGGTGDPDAIGRLARKEEVVVHVVCVSRPAERAAREIARTTGGILFDKLKTTGEIDRAVDSLARSHGADRRCVVRWQSGPDCAHDRAVAVALGRSDGSGRYSAPPGSMPTLQVQPAVVVLPAASSGVAEAMLHAEGGPIHIRRTTTDHPDVTVEPHGAFTIPAGDSLPLRIAVTRPDSLSFTARIIIESDACRPVLSAVRKEGKPKLSIPTVLRLVQPNGGEVLLSGSIGTFLWSGSNGRPVDVDASLDNGATWRSVAKGAMGKSAAWPVPPAPSRQCRARISIDTISPATILTPWDAGPVYFSEDGSIVIGRQRLSSRVDIWSVDNATSIEQVSAKEIVALDQERSLLHLLVTPLAIESWSLERGEVVSRLNLAPLGLHGLCSFAPDLERCATTDWIGRDSTIITIWSLDPIEPVASRALPGILSAVISPDGRHILAQPIFGDTTGRLIGDGFDMEIPLADAFGMCFQRRGASRLWYARSWEPGSAQDSTSIVAIDAADRAIREVGPFAGTGIAFDISDDGSAIALLVNRTNRREVLFMDEVGDVIERRTVGSDIRAIALGEGGRKYALVRGDSSVEVRWVVGEEASDESDSVWSIVAPSISLTPCDTSGWIGHRSAVSIDIRSESIAPGLRLPFQFQIVVDPPLLLPTRERWWMEKGRRVIEVKSVLDDTSYRQAVEVVPLLGASDKASITIGNAQWIDGDTIESGSPPNAIGAFTIHGICSDNGGRLVRDGEVRALRMIREGPRLVVEWSGFDDGERRFRLYNLLGELVDTIVARGRQGRLGAGGWGLEVGELLIVVE